jgi:hypothetical protein
VRIAWIARDPGKNDRVDSEKLAELERTGNYRPVIHLKSMEMVHFKMAVKQYEERTEDVARQKTKIKALMPDPRHHHHREASPGGGEGRISWGRSLAAWFRLCCLSWKSWTG